MKVRKITCFESVNIIMYIMNSDAPKELVDKVFEHITQYLNDEEKNVVYNWYNAYKKLIYSH